LIKEPMNTVRILFCGHSHLPILFRKEKGFVTREPVPPGLPVILQRTGRYIFIAGAAADGEKSILPSAICPRGSAIPSSVPA